MTTMSEMTAEMDALEHEARNILGNPGLTPLERRRAIGLLLRKFQLLEEYQRALAAYIRRMQDSDQAQAPDPDEVIREILASTEFAGLRCNVLAAVIAVTYANGQRAAWVPMSIGTIPGLRR